MFLWIKETVVSVIQYIDLTNFFLEYKYLKFVKSNKNIWLNQILRTKKFCSQQNSFVDQVNIYLDQPNIFMSVFNCRWTKEMFLIYQISSWVKIRDRSWIL